MKRGRPEDHSALLDVIELWKSQEHIELEIRVENVGKSYFEAFREQLEKVAGKPRWSPIKHETFLSVFSGRDPARESSVRTRYWADREPVSESVRTVARLRYNCPTRGESIQVSVKEEKPVPTDYGVDHYMIRAHERSTVAYDTNWYYSIQDVRQGSTKDNLQTCAPEYNVEIELGDALKTVESAELARLILGRASDMLRRYDETGREDAIQIALTEKRIKNESNP
jgi:hypothetical protein